MKRSMLAAGVLLGAVGMTAPGTLVSAGASGVSGCGTANLTVHIKAGSPGAGQRYATVVLTNRTTGTCTVQGYGGLALLGAPGKGVPTDLRWVSTPAPTRVVLAPGGSARALLHWTVVPGSGENQALCQPSAVTAVVTPPNQSTAALVPWHLGPVCQHGRIDENAYVAGAAAF